MRGLRVLYKAGRVTFEQAHECKIFLSDFKNLCGSSSQTSSPFFPPLGWAQGTEQWKGHLLGGVLLFT